MMVIARLCNVSDLVGPPGETAYHCWLEHNLERLSCAIIKSGGVVCASQKVCSEVEVVRRVVVDRDGQRCQAEVNGDSVQIELKVNFSVHSEATSV